MINNIAYTTIISRPGEAGTSRLCVRFARTEDIQPCKAIADRYRDVFGFLTRAIFQEAAEHQRLLVAELDENQLAGFVRFNHRVRGVETAIYDICVDIQFQRQGIGRAMVIALAQECRKFDRETIALRCPEGAAANDFYKRMNFKMQGVKVGKRRQLIVWTLPVESVL